MSIEYNITADFIQTAKAFSDNIFLCGSDFTVTYGEMDSIVRNVSSFIDVMSDAKRVGILGTRSVEAYAGILAAGFLGATYIPLNVKWPEQRLVELLSALDLDVLIVDPRGCAHLSAAVLQAAPDLIITGGSNCVQAVRSSQTVTMFSTIRIPFLERPCAVRSADIAYILFTSGTTGHPKGVMISAGALKSYLDEAVKWTAFTADDRIAEASDITFDLSVHNLFLCVRAGASLHVLSALEMLAPTRFIRERSITVWMSVPTLVAMMRRSGALKPGVLPGLRSSVFCGEPLTVAAAQAWMEAAPNSSVDNIYGPTEATVICLRQRLSPQYPVTPGRDVVAIGTPYDTMQVAIFDANQQPVAPGQPGEIALSGPQLADGYFNDGNQPASDRFRVIDGVRWYLTGDLGMRDHKSVFHHLGRADNQVKLKGNRVELEEVEVHLRHAAESEMAAVIAWPVIDGSAQGLVAFCVSDRSADEIGRSLHRVLPRYMVPEVIHLIDVMPVSINGKIDRKQLSDRLVKSPVYSS